MAFGITYQSYPLPPTQKPPRFSGEYYEQFKGGYAKVTDSNNTYIIKARGQTTAEAEKNLKLIRGVIHDSEYQKGNVTPNTIWYFSEISISIQNGTDLYQASMEAYY